MKKDYSGIFSGIVCPAVAVMGLVASAATEVQWTGAGGDKNLVNENNWPNSALPSTPDLSAKLTATTENDPYVMQGSALLKSYSITLTDGLTFDLGIGNSFLAGYRVNVNTTDKTYNLKSGTFGVDWDSESGERFFIGDAGNGGNTFNVSGPGTVLMGSYKSTLQVGTNKGQQRLNVTDGATLKANLAIGNNATAHSNVTWIASARHSVPSSSTATALSVGTTGGWNSYVLTNSASLVSDRNANIYMPNCVNHLVGAGHNRIVIADHSSFTTPGTLDIGYSANDNGVILTGGSDLSCRVLNVASEIDSQAIRNVSGNFLRASGAGTKVHATVNATVGGYGTGTEVRMNDGAEMYVDDTLMLGGAGSSTNTLFYVGTNSVLDVKKGLAVGYYTSGSAYSDIMNARMVFDHGTLFYTNSVVTGRTATFNGNGISNGVEFVNGARAVFSSPGGSVNVNNLGCARGGYFKVRDAGTLVQFFDQNIYLGGEDGARGGFFQIDGGTVAITNATTRRTFRIGDRGQDSMLEITNGGCLTFTNSDIEVCGGGETAVSNVLRVANGGRFEGQVSNSVGDGIYIGLYGVGGLDVDGGDFRSPQILRISHTNTKGGGSWARIRNGGYVEVNRVIMGETTKNNRVYIDNGTLKTIGDAIQLGTNNADCSDDAMYITGTNAFVRSGASISLSPKSFVQFDIGRYGLCTTAAVVSVKSSFTVTSQVTAEDPVTIRITDNDPERDVAGTYTLIEAGTGTINWDKIKLVYPDSVRIVTKTDKKLVVKVYRKNNGLIMFVR